MDTGTRARVLYLAQMHPSPRTPSAERVGLWAPGRYFNGYYDPSLWGEDEDFKMYKDARKCHYRAGLAVEVEAVRSGLLKIRRRMCGCPPCSPPNFNFGQCVLKYVDALPSEAEAPRCPHADPGACRVLRVARRERGVRGQGG